MTIKFTCPECKAVMSVADSMAGKKGKCKCGQQITVPAANATASAASKPAKSVAAASGPGKSASGLGQVFDELTDADYQRESPLQKMYAKQVAVNEGAMLKRFDQSGNEKKKVRRVKPGVLNGTAKLMIGGYCLLAAAGIAMCVLLAMDHAILKQIEGFIVEVRWGKGLAIAFFAASSLLFIAAAVGLILKQLWGWMLAAAVMTCAVLERALGLGMLFTGTVEQTKLIGGIVSAVIPLLLVAFVYQKNTRRIFKVESNMLLAIAAGVGLCLAGIIAAVLFGTGAFSPPT